MSLFTQCRGRSWLTASTVLQGVRELYEIKKVDKREDEGAISPKLVLIGRDLPKSLPDAFLSALQRSL